jgi:DnaJ-class molecular chaperone
MITCDVCEGTGFVVWYIGIPRKAQYEDKTEMQECPACDGKGYEPDSCTVDTADSVVTGEPKVLWKNNWIEAWVLDDNTLVIKRKVSDPKMNTTWFDHYFTVDTLLPVDKK